MIKDHLRERLSAAEILALAQCESGAREITEPGLIDRLTGFVDWIDAHGPYTPDQVWAMRAQIQRVLATRLKLALDRERFPGIADEAIRRPVFIIGFARSGTSMLHSLLAADPQVLTLRGWHMYAPTPPPGARPVAAERIAYANRMIEAWMDFCPAQKMLHPYVDKRAYQPVEDEELLSLDFRNAYPYQFYRVPVLEPAAVRIGGDVAGAFRFHRSVLQHLQWNTGLTQWVCKATTSHMFLEALLEVYPDALCVWPHRPIVEMYASNVAVRAATFDTIQGRANDWSSQAADAARAMKQSVDRMLASQAIEDPRILHLRFHEIAADPIGAVRQIYQRLDRPLSEQAEAAMRGWLGDPENAADRFGRYPYSYEAFGLDRDWVQNLFADYSSRFGLN